MKKIIHVDMDAFYASVEQRENPELKGKPVIVGGPPDSRGVVCACSYEARKFGVRSAMASSMAYRLCPHGIFLRPHFSRYRKISEEIHSVFREYTDLVEPLSLDEAFLDVTDNHVNEPYATKIALQIKEKIYKKTGCTSSAGVSYNKFLAKVASDFNKPDGLTVVTPEKAPEFIENLEVNKFFGIGKVTSSRLKEMGVAYGRDLKEISKIDLINIFGKTGEFYYNIVRGKDERPVEPFRIRKSIGKEHTYQEDIGDISRMHSELDKIADSVYLIMEQSGASGKTVTVKVKYFDFVTVTRSFTAEVPFRDPGLISQWAIKLLEKTEVHYKKVRLLGISMSGLQYDEESFNDEDLQLYFNFT